jgi:outer membrane protein insertion porin family
MNPEGPSIEEQVPIKAIEVDGNTEVPTADILQVVTSRIGELADRSKIARDLQNIYEMGYFTDVKVRTEPFLNGVKFVYHVLENPKVRSIQIAGNKIVPTEKLRSLMEAREGHILNTKTLFADVTVINRYYDNELGYLLEPTHISSLKFTPEGDLQLTLQEGVVVKSVRVTGNTVVPTRQLLPLVRMKPGQLFNQFTMKDDSERLSKLYEKKDYILDNIKPSIDKSTGVVTYNIIEAVVEDIRVEGNTHTHGQVIKRLMFTKVGTVLKRTRLQHDVERLNSTGYFESVNVEPEPGSEAGKVVLVMKVKEQKTGQVTLGLGWTGGGTGALQAGVTGAISFAEKNLGGSGQSAGVSWQRGVGIQTYGANFYNPAINNAQDSIGFSFFSSQFSELRQPVVNGNGAVSNFALYDESDTGFSATYGKWLSEDWRAFISARHEYLSIVEDSRSSFKPVGLGQGSVNSVSFAALLDTRDDLFNPHRGAYANGTVALAGGPLGGAFSYTKFQLELRKYLPSGKNTIALRGWAGIGNGTLPLTEIFYLGGPDTLRGYLDNSFFGSRFYLANAEYRFPVAKLKMLNFAVFGDAGDAWFAGQRTKVFSDAGVGLRLVFPSLGLGVIRIDYAIGQQGGRSTIGIGQTF